MTQVNAEILVSNTFYKYSSLLMLCQHPASGYDLFISFTFMIRLLKQSSVSLRMRALKNMLLRYVSRPCYLRL